MCSSAIAPLLLVGWAAVVVLVSVVVWVAITVGGVRSI
jgi:hypothetical protein